MATRARERSTIPERAGTRLDHRFTEAVYGTGRRGRTQHGSYDRRQRVYQCGGELSNFIYWRERLVSFDLEVWRAVWDRADRLEVIDHERNECYALDVEAAITAGRMYDAGLGPRFGVPLDLWTRLDAAGNRLPPRMK